MMNLKKFGTFLKQRIHEHHIKGRIKFCTADAVQNEIKAAINEQAAAIIVGGGDGTINSSAGLLQNTGIALGILPMGTFNLAARDHGIAVDPETAVDQLCKARVDSVPLVRINNYPCLCTASIGFYPRLMKLMNQIKHTKWWLRSLQIVWSSLFYFTRCPVFRFTVQTDHQMKPFKSRMIIIVPGSYEDTVGLIPQRDTRFPNSISLYIFKHLGRIAILRGIIFFISGRINKNPDVQIVNTETASLLFKKKKLIKVMIDGETMLLTNPLQIELKPGSLKLLLPAGVTAM